MMLNIRHPLGDWLSNNRARAEYDRLLTFARPNRINRIKRRAESVVHRRSTVFALDYAPALRNANDTKNVMVKIANPSRFQSLALAVIALNNRLRQVTNNMPRQAVHRRELDDPLRLRIATEDDVMLIPHIVNFNDLTREQPNARHLDCREEVNLRLTHADASRRESELIGLQ